jgi:hypothetical protein
MKLTLAAGERPALLGSLGLPETASDAEISAAVASRLTSTPAAEADPSPPDEYPAEWLPPSQLAPWPRPVPRVTPVERVTHGGD